MMFFLDAALLAGGYAASIYTWPWLRTKLQGAQAEITALEARAASLKAALAPVVAAVK